ncbi:MAG TPA: FHA domain-containing protein [Ktedonobacterales bacterium]|nr:FHA domain-containing protein [Ktedonobacterales bacterium]
MPDGLLRRYSRQPKTTNRAEPPRVGGDDDQTRRARPHPHPQPHPCPQRLGMLIFGLGEETERVVEMCNDRLTIGRSGECDLVLDDPAASRIHAIITHDAAAGTYRLQDQDSVNGTFVNRQRIREHLLEDGDEIQLGLTVVVFRQD